MDFIEKIKESSNKLLKAEIEGAEKWKGLKHNKECLELILNFTICEIEFVTKDNDIRTIVASSNTPLIKLFSLKKPDEKTLETLRNMKSNGIHTNDPFRVVTWDFLRNQWCDINLSLWRIINCVTISGENLVVLNSVMKDLLGYHE